MPHGYAPVVKTDNIMRVRKSYINEATAHKRSVVPLPKG
jgi:hypothetical protein